MKTKIKSTIYFFYGFWNLFKFLVFDLKKIRDAEIVCFFPYYHTGGAEKVHLNIVKALSNKNVCVIFTLNSATKNFQEQFKASAQCIEINPILNKRNSFVSRMLKKSIYKTINTSNNCKVVFGSNAAYFYQILPYISGQIVRIDLFHAFSRTDSPELEVVNSVKYIDKRVVINQSTKKDLLEMYSRNDIGLEYYEVIRVIENGISISNRNFFAKDYSNIKVGYVGRWSDEKRPEIFLEIAKQVQKIPQNFQFYMAGTGMKSNLDQIENAGVVFLGELTSNEELSCLYKELSLLLITSEYEGFPMVIMESMVQGVISISTNVGGISEHITNNKNGILIRNTTKEEIVVDFIKAIEQLVYNREKMQEMGKNAFQYAQNKFDINSFNENYKELFEVESNTL
ncbi:glycosyltransferase family 4 protein [Flavobacterium sp. GNP002]